MNYSITFPFRFTMGWSINLWYSTVIQSVDLINCDCIKIIPFDDILSVMQISPFSSLAAFSPPHHN